MLMVMTTSIQCVCIGCIMFVGKMLQEDFATNCKLCLYDCVCVTVWTSHIHTYVRIAYVYASTRKTTVTCTHTSNICTNHTQHKQACQGAWTVNTPSTNLRLQSVSYRTSFWHVRANEHTHVHSKNLTMIFKASSLSSSSSSIIEPVGECRHRKKSASVSSHWMDSICATPSLLA